MKNENLSVSLDERLGQLLSRTLNEETEMNPEDCPTPLTMAAFIEGGLDEEPRRQVTTHVSRCGLCREWIGELHLVGEELPDLLGAFSAGDEESGPRQHVGEQGADPHKSSGGLRLAFSRKDSKRRKPGISGLTIPQWAGLAASLLLVIGVAWFMSRQPGFHTSPLARESLNARVIAQRLPVSAFDAGGDFPREFLGFSATGHPRSLHFQSGRWLASLAAANPPVDADQHLHFAAQLESARFADVSSELFDELPPALAGKPSEKALAGWISRFEEQLSPESWPYVLLGEWCFGAERAAQTGNLNYFRPEEIRAFTEMFRERVELPGLLRSLERLKSLAQAAPEVPGRFEKITGEIENLNLLFE